MCIYSTLLFRYPHSRLLEINSHSLFSRWFSESGKLVQKLFSTVTDMVEDEDTFIVVLIGEIVTGIDYRLY
jgi:pachytene checkpoint protein 2